MRQYEYDLILSADVNTSTNIQWFYFRLSNIDSDARYRFNIINLEKPGSQYNGGMFSRYSRFQLILIIPHFRKFLSSNRRL